MIWPFKRRKAIPFAEYAKTLPDAPCGYQVEHHQYKFVQQMPCPYCAAIKAARREQNDREALANLIASKVVHAATAPLEMRLCESVRLQLKPDQFYIFRVDQNCAECTQMAAAARGQA